MKAHIKKIHHDKGLAFNNPYGAVNVTSFGYPNYNLKSNYSQSNAVFNDGAGVWGPANRSNRQRDFMDSIIDFLRKQVEIKELQDRLMPPYHSAPFSQQFYYPPTLGRFVQKSPNFLGLPFYQSSPAINTGSFNIISPASDRNDKNLGEGEASVKQSYQLISLRGSICEKCLTIFTIPIYQYEDGTLKEIHNHSCNEERVLDLGRKGKHNLNKFFVILPNLLSKILAAKVVKCNRSQAKIHLCFTKCDDLLPNTEVYSYGSVNYPIRYLDAFPSEHRWISQIINSQERKGNIELEKKELSSFLEISIDSTMIILKVKRDLSLSTSSENWDSYIVGLNLPEHSLEIVSKPFAPKLSN